MESKVDPGNEDVIESSDAGRTRRASERVPLHVSVRFTMGSLTLGGWTLNESLGGIRAIVEDCHLLPDSVLEVSLDDEARTRRTMRVVWSRKAVGGSVVGLAYA